MRFKDQASAFESLVGFEFTPPNWKAPFPNNNKTPFLEGWAVVRIEEKVGIVEARVCPMYIGYKSPSLSEIFKDGAYHPPKMPDCFVAFRATITDWRERFPDCLTCEVPHASVSPSVHGPPYIVTFEVLKNIVDNSQQFFDELRALKSITIPWPQQDFMDAEAFLNSLRQHKIFPNLNREQLGRLSRAGREPEEIARAQYCVNKLMQIGCDAANAWRKYNDASRRKDFVPGTVTYDENTWLDRMRMRFPGFSDWVYNDAIHDFGFWATR